MRPALSFSSLLREAARIRDSWPVGLFYLGYAALYVILDQLTFGRPSGLGTTPWNPAAGLALFLLIACGLRCFPVVLIASMLSQALLIGAPISPLLILLAGLTITGGYAAAVVLLRVLGFTVPLRRTLDLVLLVIVMIGSAGVVACGIVATYAMAGLVPWKLFPDAAFQRWTGNVVGLVVLVPSLLLLWRPIDPPAARLRGWPRLIVLEAAAQAAATVAAPLLFLSYAHTKHPFEWSYVLFLPVVWIAARRGLAWTSWAVLTIQVLLIAGSQLLGGSYDLLRGYQVETVALALTGLLLGAVVSERRRLSDALFDSENQRAAILNTAQDGIMTVDMHGQIQSLNATAERLFARPAEDLIGSNLSSLIDVAPERLPYLCSRDGATGAMACAELLARRADGTQFPVELTLGRSSIKGCEHYTVVLRDVTQRTEAEQRERLRNAERIGASRISLAGEMAAGIAHEVSQPLTALIAYGRGCLHFLRKPQIDAGALNEGLSEMVRQAERAADILTRLREIVSVGQTHRRSVPVEPMIEAAVRIVRIVATHNRVRIDVHMDPDLPEVFADPVQIEQVLVNLLRNAVDAIVNTEAKERLVTVVCRRGEAAVEISIADTGPGIAEELKHKIFEPFLTTKADGMGMGLSISRRIIEAHGGKLKLAERTEPGAAFAFDLPTEPNEESDNAG